MLRHKEAPHYPALFYPEPIERIRTGKPPEPSLSLIPLPFKPSAPPESQAPIFDCDVPQRLDYRWLGSAAIVTVMLGSIMGGLGLVGLFGTAALAMWYWSTYPERQAAYHRKYQQHQREIKQFHQQLAQQKGEYQHRLNAYQQECDRIEQENQRLRFEHERECAALRTLSAIEQWRTSQLNSVVLQPQLLAGQVDVTQFDPRSYAEFESNCEFPTLLRYYFSDKIHILRYLNTIIPHFSYIDEQAGLSVAIEINVPYTPRQYPNSDTALKLLHCIGQDEKRIKTFQSSDWFVLVFSERQVLKWPHQCCKAIAQLIDEQTGTKLVKTHFQKVADVQLDPQWTEAMATDMAKKQARLKYAHPLKYSHVNADETQSSVFNVGESPSKTKNRVRNVIRKKFTVYMKSNPDLEATDEVKRRFVETFLEPDKEGFVTDWLYIKGVEQGLDFLKDWTR